MREDGFLPHKTSGVSRMPIHLVQLIPLSVQDVVSMVTSKNAETTERERLVTLESLGPEITHPSYLPSHLPEHGHMASSHFIESGE